MSTNNSDHQFAKVCLMLQSEEKGQRNLGLQKISNILKSDQGKHEVPKLWDVINRSLSRMLNDSAEICRDQAVEILQLFLNNLPPDDKNLRYVIPILSQRLGLPERIEVSEEVRLKCVTLLKTIIPRYKDHLLTYVNDLTKIITNTLVDHYPLIKRQSCDCVSEFAKNLPRHFYTQSESFVKPILSNFTHQQHKVRIASVVAIGNVIQYGNSKSMEEVAVPLAERLFDQSGLVRKAVIEVAGYWLLNLKDKYSWWHKILPLLLTGLHDDLEEIRIKAATLWNDAGLLYIEENQNDEKLRNKMNFCINDPLHYPNICRSNFGCRTIVQRNFSKLINGITLELGDWLPDIRIRSAQLLCVLILNAEEDVIQHIEKLLPSMYRACNDEEKSVVENVEKAAEYLGYFIHPKIYCHLIIPTLEETLTPGHLRVLSAVLRGSECNSLVPFLERIGTFLRQPHICQSNKVAYQEQILCCCSSLYLVCKEDCKNISEDLFIIVFTVLSMATNDMIKAEAEKLLKILTRINSFETTDELYSSYIRSVISSFSDCKSWTIHNTDSKIFSAYLVYAGKSIAAHVDIALPILKDILASDADPELRLKYFILLSEYFNQETYEFNSFNRFLKEFLEDCILPGLIWFAGRTAETIRIAAVSCLCIFLEKYSKTSIHSTEEMQNVNLYFTEDIFFFIFDKVMPALVSLVDESSKKGRLYSLRAICAIMSIGKVFNYTTEDHIHKIYPVILKRLDDGCDDIRYASLEVLVDVWSTIPKDYNVIINKGHVDTLYTTIMIHLDDPESNFQDITLESLKEMATIYPSLLYEKLQNSKLNFRNQKGISILLEHCENILRTNDNP